MPFLGKDIETNTPVVLGDIERRSSLYVLGKPGTGKSTLLTTLAHQDMAAGLSGFFLDPHGEAVTKAVAKLPVRFDPCNVIILDPAGEERVFGINPLHCEKLSSFTAREDTLQKTYTVFKRLWEKEAQWGLWLPLILRNSLPVLIETGYTLAEMPMFLVNRDFRSYVLEKAIYSGELADFWNYEFKEDQAQPALIRVRSLLSNRYVRHIIGQKETMVDFAKLTTTPGKFVFLKLPPNLDDESRHFIGTIIVSELQHAIMSRKDTWHTFCLYVDEFQHFATDQFAKFILEGRKFGCAITLAHQERIGQFGENEKILGATMACANKVIFQCTVKDARELAPEFAQKPVFTETRKIPELVISKEPVWDILNKGHPNPRVQELAYIHFTPFYELIWRLRAELEEKYLIRVEFLDQAAEAQIDASISRSQSQPLRYGRLVTSPQLTQIGATLDRALSLRQNAEEVIFGIQLRKNALERNRQDIKKTNEFLTAIMEGRQTIIPPQERIAEFIIGLFIGEDFGFGEIMALYRSIYNLYIRLLFGDPSIERYIPDFLAAKYYRSEIEKIYEQEKFSKFRQRTVDWLMECRKRAEPKPGDAVIVRNIREHHEKAIAHFKKSQFYVKEGLSDMYWDGIPIDGRYEVINLSWSIPSLPKRIIQPSEIQKLKDICFNELTALIKAGKRDVFKVTLEISELCQLLSQPENHVKVPSGVYKEVAVHVASTQEMVNQAVQALTELPRYTAMAKVIEERGGEQRVWKGHVLTQDLPRDTYGAGIEEHIIEQTGERCYRSRDAIEKEIATRRTSWRPRPPPEDPQGPKVQPEAQPKEQSEPPPQGWV
jgi:hypothetical protein